MNGYSCSKVGKSVFSQEDCIKETSNARGVKSAELKGTLDYKHTHLHLHLMYKPITYMINGLLQLRL